jgi:hypothetical protein
LTEVGNREEVAATQWVDRDRLPEFLAEVQASGGQLTPWFQLISQVGREYFTRLCRMMENAKIYFLSFLVGSYSSNLLFMFSLWKPPS